MTPIMHARILATSRGVAVLRGQFSLLVCLGLDPLLEASTIKFLLGYAAISPALGLGTLFHFSAYYAILLCS